MRQFGECFVGKGQCCLCQAWDWETLALIFVPEQLASKGQCAACYIIKVTAKDVFATQLINLDIFATRINLKTFLPLNFFLIANALR